MKTRKKIIKKKKVNNLKCSPKTKKNSFTCYSDESLNKLKKAWNTRHPDRLIKSNKSFEIWKNLKDNLNQVCENEACWLKQKFIENKLDNELLQYTFAPKAPDIWRTAHGKNTWLSSLDIEKVLKQFEYKYKNFAFLGPSPIDFDTPKIHNSCVWEELCKFELSNFLKKNKNKIGIVFNTDPHTKGGAHWICLMIDVSKEIIYFFDSVGDKPPKQIDNFVERVIKQGKSLGINFKYLSNHPFEHQMGNTECGIYVIYFLTEILQGQKNYEYFNTVSIPDKEMEKYRNIYFN